jgi:N-acetyl-1-D-myo-inositol-2-amino-2-deoxy-alpha-D-glucopyranoside deacetylase
MGGMTSAADPAPDQPTRRLLLVHAHPDDETIGTGATMARYAAEGAGVTLVTCTLGEEGEIFLPELYQLAAGQADQLGGYRIGELAAACAALGVTDQRYLGGPGRYRDSGMMGLPSNEHPRSFWQAPLDDAAALLVPVIREVRPQVVVTYDPNGFYGHPDHIQAHRVAMRGVELAADAGVGADAPWQVSKVYWTAVPKSTLLAGMEAFSSSGANPFAGVTDPDDLPFGSPDEDVAAVIETIEQTPAKLAAIRAHASQIAPDSWLYTLATMDGALGVEHFRLAVGTRGEGEGEHGWETDLFAGLNV